MTKNTTNTFNIPRTGHFLNCFNFGSLDFNTISRPLTNLFQKDVPFVFDDDCKEAFETLKKALTTAPVVEPPDWNLPFEIMCDASDFAVGAVLGQ